MTILGFLIFIICFLVLASVAYWLITKFAPAPAQMPVLALVGLLLLIVLLAQFFPEAGNYRIWR